MSHRTAKVLAALLTVGVIPLSVSGCGGTCSSLCDVYITCGVEDLDEAGCEFDDREEDVIADCESECEQAFDRLSGDEADEAEACFACILDEVGDVDACDAGDFADAASDCEDECEEGGAEEHGEEFFDNFDPDIDCGGDDTTGPGPAPN